MMSLLVGNGGPISLETDADARPAGEPSKLWDGLAASTNASRHSAPFAPRVSYTRRRWWSSSVEDPRPGCAA